MLLPYIKYIWKTKLGLDLVSLPYFLHDVWRRKFIITLYLINWPNFTAWLLLFLDVLGDMCIAIVCCPLCTVIHFEINLSLLIKQFSYMIKKSGQKCKYLKNEKSFQLLTWKAFFIIFKELSVVRNCKN